MIDRTSVLKIIEANPKLAGFDLFWACYPKRKKKGDAMKAWVQTKKHRPPIEELLAALDKQKNSDDWYRDSGQWIPLPATWLRSWQWLDE